MATDSGSKTLQTGDHGIFLGSTYGCGNRERLESDPLTCPESRKSRDLTGKLMELGKIETRVFGSGLTESGADSGTESGVRNPGFHSRTKE